MEKSYPEITSPEIEALWREYDEYHRLWMEARRTGDRRGDEYARRWNEIESRIKRLKDEIYYRQ